MRALLWVFVAAGLGLAARGLRPPAPLPADAPATTFSAERAFPVIEALAAEPRARPSSHHAKSRAYLAERLRALGLEPVEPEAVVDGNPVTNLLARRAGTGAQSGAVLLCAHYDSVAAGRGAGDDALGCAVLIETARALLTGPPPARDLILLFTDGEEIALLGARAFLGGGDAGAPPHPWAQEVALALNFEARGSGGPAWMFQTGPGNLELVRALGRAPHPAASSLAKAVYDRMPNDTDLTIFLRAGIPGMNWACVDRYASYHTALDVPERLDRGTLQQMGEQALSIARWALDHPPPFDAGADAAYFTMLGGAFVAHPLAWTRALAVLPAAAFLAWIWRRRIGVKAILLGVPVLGAALMAAALIVLLAVIASGWNPESWTRGSDLRLRAVGLGLTIAAVLAAFGAAHLKRCIPPADPGAAALLAAAAGAILLAFQVPEGAFLLSVPATVVPLALLVPGSGTPALLARGAAILTVISLTGVWVYSLILALGPIVFPSALLATLTALLLVPLWSFPVSAARAAP
jgi:hypothetical protein